MSGDPPDIERINPYSFLSQRLRRVDGSPDRGGRKGRQEQPEQPHGDVVELHTDEAEASRPDEQEAEGGGLDVSA